MTAIFTPEINWHDRESLLFVDVCPTMVTKALVKKGEGVILAKQIDDNAMEVNDMLINTVSVYKIATVSVGKEIRVWEFYFTDTATTTTSEGNKKRELGINFLANITGHESTTNIVRFSPNGSLLASGDVNGTIMVWRLIKPGSEEDVACSDSSNSCDDLPPNKENWLRVLRNPIRISGDINCLCFSPDSSKVVSVSNGEYIQLHNAMTGSKVWESRLYRHFSNGVTWDPRNKYIITASTDRKLDILDAARGTRVRTCDKVILPTTLLDETTTTTITQTQARKIFHDDQLPAFIRGVEFSPCGSLLFAPCAHFDVGNKNVYGTYVFRRPDFDKCRPHALLRTDKPTMMVKCSPVAYELRKETETNFLELPYRIIFAVMCSDCVLLYDTQHARAFSYIANIQFQPLTSMSWSPDGKVLVVSSMEGYNTFITLDQGVIGQSVKIPESNAPDSPKLKQLRKPRKVITKEVVVEAVVEEAKAAVLEEDKHS